MFILLVDFDLISILIYRTLEVKYPLEPLVLLIYRTLSTAPILWLCYDNLMLKNMDNNNRNLRAIKNRAFRVSNPGLDYPYPAAGLGFLLLSKNNYHA